jgi:hypothetical protein
MFFVTVRLWALAALQMLGGRCERHCGGVVNREILDLATAVFSLCGNWDDGRDLLERVVAVRVGG